jgi:hypothetical protein
MRHAYVVSTIGAKISFHIFALAAQLSAFHGATAAQLWWRGLAGMTIRVYDGYEAMYPLIFAKHSDLLGIELLLS